MLGWIWTDLSVLGSQLFGQASLESCVAWTPNSGRSNFVDNNPLHLILRSISEAELYS